MFRLHILLAAGLVLTILLAIAVRWLAGQRWRGAGIARRGSILVVAAACPVLLVLLAGGLRFLWHERRNQPATVADLKILERADALLADEASWNRSDDKQCERDDRLHKWSLYCAIEAACRGVVGTCEHTRVASQEVRFAIEDVTHGRQFEGRLTGFNNLPETRLADVKHVLRVARERVQQRLAQSERRRRTSGLADTVTTTQAGFLGLLSSGIVALLAGLMLTRLHWRPDIPAYGRQTGFLGVALHPDRYVKDAPVRVIRSLTAVGALLLALAGGLVAYEVLRVTPSP